jgi:GT2 family glycosyltransferase
LSSHEGTPPDVSLVVVNFDGGEEVGACLASLLTESAPTRELIVVDNASRDESPRLVEAFVEGRSDARLLRSEANLGYAGGVDLALPHCRGRYVAVLNMDLVAEPGWLGPLVDHLDRHEEVAAVNPLVALRGGRRINAAGQWIHVTGLGFNRDLGRPRDAVGDAPFPVAGLNGAAFLIRRSLLEAVGGMDTGGFLYHEDVNLSWLLRLMGFELACVPRAAVRHDYFLSMHAEKLYLLERNREAMLRAYLEPRTYRRLWAWRLVTEALMWSYALLRGPSFVAAKARARRWVRAQGTRIAARRALAARLRARPDEAVLRPMSRRYPIAQLLTLARERGAPRRPIAAADPTGASEDARHSA